MSRYVILTNRKRAIIALVHTVAFLLVAIGTGFLTVHPLHAGSSKGAWAVAGIYVLVTTALMILTAVSGCVRERIYFTCCTTSAAFGLARQILGEQIHVAVYVRVIMLALAVVVGWRILKGHETGGQIARAEAESDVQEKWRSYFCNVNDKPASIALNLGFKDQAPLLSKPVLLWVWVYLNSPRTDGLSDSTEFETLCAIEDELAKRIGRACDAIQVGRITSDGHREFYFYGAHTQGFRAATNAAMSEFKDYQFDLGDQEDVGWNQYLNVLYPSEEDMERIKNQDVLEVLVRHGDTLDAVRDVHHWIYFHSREERQHYAERVLAIGYKVVNESETDRKERPYGLQITRDQSVTSDKIDDAVSELFRLAKEFNADYDGWEAQVVAPSAAGAKEPSPGA